MVEEVRAWKDSSGVVHSRKIDAARADAKIQLEKILGNGGPLVTAILQNAEAVHVALDAFVEELLECKPSVPPAAPKEPAHA